MRSEKTQRLIYVCCDFVMANMAFVLFNIFRYFELPNALHNFPTVKSYLLSTNLLTEQLLFPIAILSIHYLSGYYNHALQKSRLQELLSTIVTSGIASLLLYFALLTNDQVELRSTNYALIAMIFSLIFGFTYIGRLYITSKTIKRYRCGKWGINTLIIGNTKRAHNLATRLISNGLGYNIIGFVNLFGEETTNTTPLCEFEIEEITNICQKFNVKTIVLAPCNNREEVTLKMLPQLFPLNIPVKIESDTLSVITSGIRLNNIYEEPMLNITEGYATDATRNIKRLTDIVISSCALILLALPMLAVAIWIKTDSHGPIFYLQQRIGYHRKIFNIIKFRTMLTDAEKFGPVLSSPNDTRITTVGRILRKYRIDELPQFWNVLRGDMSLVGPRPERQFYIDKIIQQAPWYILVHQVRPGITSWGMVKYGYAENVEQMISRLRYDIVYLENISIPVDIKILLSTIKTVLTGKGM